MEIFTIGHSTHPIERFVDLLRAAQVTLVADVRRYPGSRRNPQFGADALAGSLSAAGIGYESFARSLGGRRSGRDSGSASTRPRPDNSAWRSASFRAYADYMSEPAFTEGLERLEQVAREGRAAVLCAEAHPSRCHRQLIADALVARGWEVVHLLADGRRANHELSGHAVVEDSQVHYPGELTGRLGI